MKEVSLKEIALPPWLAMTVVIAMLMCGGDYARPA